MERATVVDGAGSDRVDVGAALETTDVAVVRYRLAPGEGLPSGLHAHHDQEEVFVVRSGLLAFEHVPPVEDWPADNRPVGETVTVAASEAVRFAPGEFQTGSVPEREDSDAVVLALGAPRETTDVRIPASCPDCDGRTLRLGTDGDAFTLDCPECGAASAPAPCPDCGGHDLAMRLGPDDRPVSRCEDCRSEYATPPLAES